ncbi:D-aminoacyl-tRNA deacylase [Sansalvadorimonas verongulae]|uniref:D-aminoacyl-tRNA deacylase n=1 Tax=Sansalvadorimonas verongulae TaxID=2172824 RepID=UPI0012BC4FB7|nr:D-aminoacyl-tRNA deacylase [Sansalvadorimonas verongulae]MTI15589.1 D-tyrosyl-tRNA(Tyr) deacylase [Sansalvadorimonas verongulae]
MKGLVQRVSHASIVVDGETIGEIDNGILLLLGVEKDDTPEKASKLLDKVLKYRMFSDEEGKMNCSVTDIEGGVLVVSQFTLVAETRKGLRPSFSSGASPALGKELYNQFVNMAKARHPKVSTGRFGADMKVSLLNDGPVTFMLEV